jgi:hypothetical protein
MYTAVSVKCIKGDGDVEAQPINDSRITEDFVAIKRGKRFLEDPSQGAYYLTKQRDLQVSHKGPTVIPGKWVDITAPQLDLDEQRVKINNYTITITKESVFATMTVQEFKEFDIYE